MRLKLKIWQKIIIFILGTIMVVFTTIFVFISQSSRKIIHNDALVYSNALAKQYANQVESWLNTIIVDAQNLLSGENGSFSDFQREMVEIIHSNANGIVHNFLVLFKADRNLILLEELYQLRAPIYSIIGFSDLLLLLNESVTDRSPLEKEQVHLIENIGNAANHVAELAKLSYNLIQNRH